MKIFFYRFYLRLLKFFSILNIKIKIQIHRIVYKYFRKEYETYFYYKIMLIVEKLFPNSSLLTKKELALTYTEIIAFKWSEKKENINLLDLIKINNEIKNDKNFKKKISEYHLYLAFYWRTFKYNNFITKIKKHIKIAHIYTNDKKTIKNLFVIVKPLNSIKRTNKKLIKKVSNNIDRYLKNERKKQFEKIIIKPEVVLLIITLFSTLFLLSGITNIKLFYHLLDFNSSIFFSISDYISGSLDRLISITISMVLGLVILKLKLNDSEENMILEEKMNITTNYKKVEMKSFYFLLFSSFIITSFAYIKFNILLYEFIMLFSSLFFILVIKWIDISKYFEEPIKITLSLIIIIIYFNYTFFGVLRNVSIVKEDSYKSEYKTTLKEKIDGFENFELIDGNSNYLFYINKINKKIVAIPFQNISTIEKK